MNNALPHISICVCTYQRPKLLRRLLEEINRQDAKGRFTFSVVIADNDQAESARATVAEIAAASPIKINYVTEPRRSFAFVRNKTIEHATGDFITFIDDDEFPVADWLFNLYQTCQQSGADGVLGPVRPFFDEGTPAWVRKGGFYDRLEHPTGFALKWQECRTGNVLFRKALIAGVSPVFRPEFATGGEDVDFFRRMHEKGGKFIWCNEAIAYEIVPPNRWKRKVLLQRALQRGSNSLKHPTGRVKSIVKSLLAIPLYTLALPFLLIAGHHLFMKYLVKLCDHAGKIMALLGVNPVRERAM